MSDRPWLVALSVYTRLALGLLLLGTALVFASQNAEVVSVRFLGWGMELSQALLLFLAFTLGAVVGSLLTGWLHWSRGRAAGKAARAAGPEAGPAGTSGLPGR